MKSAVAKRYSARNAKTDLPKRSTKDNKTRGGKCLVVAGSKGLYGAAILCATAASRCGAGYVYLMTKGNFPSGKHPDFLILQDFPKTFTFKAFALGPGYKSVTDLRSMIKKLKSAQASAVVLDAEALNTLITKKSKLKPLPSSWIITPHEGELSRILQVPAQTIRQNRVKYVRLAQKQLGCVVLLKGSPTLVADAESLWQVPSGNPALAKAGTGDVLTGLILALLSQGLPPTRAALLAAHIHGWMADSWVSSGRDVLSLMASDLLALLPESLLAIRKGKKLKSLPHHDKLI